MPAASERVELCQVKQEAFYALCFESCEIIRLHKIGTVGLI